MIQKAEQFSNSNPSCTVQVSKCFVKVYVTMLLRNFGYSSPANDNRGIQSCIINKLCIWKTDQASQCLTKGRRSLKTSSCRLFSLVEIQENAAETIIIAGQIWEKFGLDVDVSSLDSQVSLVLPKGSQSASPCVYMAKSCHFSLSALQELVPTTNSSLCACVSSLMLLGSLTVTLSLEKFIAATRNTLDFEVLS